MSIQVLRQEQIRGLIKGNSTAKTELIRLHTEVWMFSHLWHWRERERIYKISFILWWKKCFGLFSPQKSTFLNICWGFLFLCLVSVTGIHPGQTGATVWRCHHCSQQSKELHFQGGQTAGNGFASCSGLQDCWRVRTSCLISKKPQSG